MPDADAAHVLVLDGSPLYAEVYGNLFAVEGYRVTMVTDCAVEPATVLAMLPDLIVVDLQCGGGQRGLDFIRQLRSDPAGVKVPVVASTPASLIDMGRFGDELRTLHVPIFDGVGQYDDLLAAAKAAIGRRP